MVYSGCRGVFRNAGHQRLFPKRPSISSKRGNAAAFIGNRSRALRVRILSKTTLAGETGLIELTGENGLRKFTAILFSALFLSFAVISGVLMDLQIYAHRPIDTVEENRAFSVRPGQGFEKISKNLQKAQYQMVHKSALLVNTTNMNTLLLCFLRRDS